MSLRSAEALKPNNFYRRLEALVGDRYEIFGYGEVEDGAEFNLRPLYKEFPHACAFISGSTLARIGYLYRGDPQVTAYDLSAGSDDSDFVLYVLIRRA